MDSNDQMNIAGPVNERVPFNQKWEIHKPLLKRLYLEENTKLRKIKDIMRDQCGFDAETHQYKYRFDKWGWKKSMSSETKSLIVRKSQQRLKAGQGTVIRYQNRDCDTRKLVRHEKAKGKKQESAILFASNAGASRHAFAFNGIAGDTMTFMNWNLPYRTLLRLFPQVMDHPSSPPVSVTTPSDVSIASPVADTALSPGLAQAVTLRTARENATLFVAGDFEGLLRKFNSDDKRTFSTWMYEFWNFGFITAKYWGRGPRHWTANDLWQNLQREKSPGLLATTPPAYLSSLDAQSTGSGQDARMQASLPSPLCRWSIHIVEQDSIEWLDESNQEDSGDPLSQTWPNEWLADPLEQKLQVGLESNSFSSVPVSELPVDLGYISHAARKSQGEIRREGLGFAIMGRNFDLIENILSRQPLDEPIQGLHPTHLAAAYLDGGKTCCNIMHLLFNQSHRFDRDAFDRDSKGHTVLDALMLRILRSHSSTQLETVNDDLKGFRGYAGEEVDICGRWDAESGSYRELISGGEVKVPLNWKHRFCHTSIQAICHSIDVISWHKAPATSGLFLRRCFSCGLALELQPLHAMVLTTVQLLRNGLNGEDLFGMICCLLQFIVSNRGHSVRFAKSHVSTHLLQHGVGQDGCTHEELSPFELATRVDFAARQSRSSEAQKGWEAFVLILQQIEQQHRWVSERHPPPGYEEEHKALLEANEVYDDDSDNAFNNRPQLHETLDEETLDEEIFENGDLGFPDFCEHVDNGDRRAFGRNAHLGHIWAACQAELLTYRRQQETDLWLSSHITIDAILECLQTGNPGMLPYIKNEMLKPYCACGYPGGNPNILRREEACNSYFSNLDDWHRTSFIATIED